MSRLCVCVRVSLVDLLSKHFRCYSIDMAINAWKGNHFGVTLDVSAFHCHVLFCFFFIESFCKGLSFSLLFRSISNYHEDAS